jgi:retron-type reverse transcriptase
MKRINNIFSTIISLENLQEAEKKARKGKSNQYGVILFDRNAENNLLELHHQLKKKAFKTSKYTTFKVFEPKEREVYRLPYFPDRIVHHAIMNVLEPFFVSLFTKNTYSCIKGKGIHAASFDLRRSLKQKQDNKYCLKLDIKKFYPSIDHEVLKQLLMRKIKDKDLLILLFEIIDSAPGLPIGNYLSQYFANYYLTYLDHWIKESLKAKHYFRYADDIVILSDSKEELHGFLKAIKLYLKTELNLEVKDNYQVFPVEIRGIDFVGYVHFHTHVLLRKSIKQNFARMLAKKRNTASIASYNGWLKHANTINLKRKLLNETV